MLSFSPPLGDDDVVLGVDTLHLFERGTSGFVRREPNPLAGLAVGQWSSPAVAGDCVRAPFSTAAEIGGSMMVPTTLGFLPLRID